MNIVHIAIKTNLLCFERSFVA